MDSTTITPNYMEIIFKSAELRLVDFNMPLTNEGKYEVLMYGIWLGLHSMAKNGISLNQKELQSTIINFLVDYLKRLGISPDKKAERLFYLREDEWRRETRKIESSIITQSNQQMPEYLYLCFVDSPLVIFSSIDLSRKIDQINHSNLIVFQKAFVTFYNKMICDFKIFESDPQSYKKRATEIVELEYDKDNKMFYSDLEQKLIQLFKDGKKDKIDSLDDLFSPHMELVIIDEIVSKAAFSMDFLKLSQDLNSADRSAQYLKVLSDKNIKELKGEKDELLHVIRPMYEKGLETRKKCAILIMAMDNNIVADDLDSTIKSGEKLLSSIIKSIDSHIGMIDFIIKVKSENSKRGNGSNSSINKSKSGCLSLLSLTLLIVASIASVLWLST